MSQSRRERRELERGQKKNPLPSAETVTTKGKSSRRWVLLSLLLIGVVAAFIVRQNYKRPSPQSFTTKPAAITPSASSGLPVGDLTFGKLVELQPAQLAGLDVAAMNLLCASGLPGVENSNLNAELKTLDEWARHVEKEIARISRGVD